MSNAPYFRAQAKMCKELALLTIDLKFVATLNAEAERFRAEADAIDAQAVARPSEANRSERFSGLSR